MLRRRRNKLEQGKVIDVVVLFCRKEGLVLDETLLTRIKESDTPLLDFIKMILEMGNENEWATLKMIIEMLMTLLVTV